MGLAQWQRRLFYLLRPRRPPSSMPGPRLATSASLAFDPLNGWLSGLELDHGVNEAGVASKFDHRASIGLVGSRGGLQGLNCCALIADYMISRTLNATLTRAATLLLPFSVSINQVTWFGWLRWEPTYQSPGTRGPIEPLFLRLFEFMPGPRHITTKIIIQII